MRLVPGEGRAAVSDELPRILERHDGGLAGAVVDPLQFRRTGPIAEIDRVLRGGEFGPALRGRAGAEIIDIPADRALPGSLARRRRLHLRRCVGKTRTVLPRGVTTLQKGVIGRREVDGMRGTDPHEFETRTARAGAAYRIEDFRSRLANHRSCVPGLKALAAGAPRVDNKEHPAHSKCVPGITRRRSIKRNAT
jgi:hypothetical protein